MKNLIFTCLTVLVGANGYAFEGPTVRSTSRLDQALQIGAYHWEGASDPSAPAEVLRIQSAQTHNQVRFSLVDGSVGYHIPASPGNVMYLNCTNSGVCSGEVSFNRDDITRPPTARTLAKIRMTATVLENGDIVEHEEWWQSDIPVWRDAGEIRWVPHGTRD